MTGHVGVTGTRKGATDAQRKALARELKKWKVLHHGDCEGADVDAHLAARARGMRVVVHPPLDRKLRANCKGDQILAPQEYLTRNRHIVLAVACLIAVPSGSERMRSGTWATVRYARKVGVPVVLIWRDGSVTREKP